MNDTFKNCEHCFHTTFTETGFHKMYEWNYQVCRSMGQSCSYCFAVCTTQQLLLRRAKWINKRMHVVCFSKHCAIVVRIVCMSHVTWLFFLVRMGDKPKAEKRNFRNKQLQFIHYCNSMNFSNDTFVSLSLSFSFFSIFFPIGLFRARSPFRS